MPVTEFKKAGVFIGILHFNEYIKNPHIIFTQRSTKLSSHSGEVSYPGGKWEDGDIDLLDTALRESNEEINLNRSDVVALGNLPYLISRHKIEVHPYVGLITNEQDLIGNFEIKEIFTVLSLMATIPSSITASKIHPPGDATTGSLNLSKL